MKMNSRNAKHELLMFIILFISRAPFGFGSFLSFFFFFAYSFGNIYSMCLVFIRITRGDIKLIWMLAII